MYRASKLPEQFYFPVHTPKAHHCLSGTYRSKVHRHQSHTESNSSSILIVTLIERQNSRPDLRRDCEHTQTTAHTHIYRHTETQPILETKAELQHLDLDLGSNAPKALNL